MAPVRCLLRFLFAGSRVLRRLYHSQASPGPILRVLGQNALCSPHCSKRTFSKRPLFYHCTELSLPSLLPAKAKDQSQKLLLALRKSHSLPFSASPWIRPPDSSGIALTISIWPTAVVAVIGQCPPKASAPLSLYLLSKWCCLGVCSKQMVSILIFLRFLQTSFPFSFCLALCSSGASSSRRRCLCPSLAHSHCVSISEVQVARDWGRFACGPILAGDEYIWGLLCAPKGALDTSLIRLPHTTVQTLAQTLGQLPGLGQRLFVKESQSHACPGPAEVSLLLSMRKQWHTSHPPSCPL